MIQGEVWAVIPARSYNGCLMNSTENPVQANTIRIKITCPTLVTPQRCFSFSSMGR